MFGDCVFAKRSTKSTKRMTGVAAAVAAAALVLTGCSSTQPGAAALVGDTRISESDLNNQISALLTAQGLTPADATSELVTSTLDRMITESLVSQLAEREGIEIVQGDIDDVALQYLAQAGSQEELDNLLLQQGVLPTELENIITVNLQVGKLGEVLAPGTDAEVQSGAVFVAVSELSTELGTEVSPRFGIWDPESLQVGEAPNDLSAPLGVELGQE